MIRQLLHAIPLLLIGHAAANASAPSCAALAEQAAAAHGIPPNLLSAISTVETQHKGKPWPWTLNEGGKSLYFDSKREALRYLTDAVARGVKNIDVGCMQLNFRWHAAGFSSLEAMLDPKKNTDYAALFLVELKKRVGSWEEATKHYHSSDDTRGNSYRDKVVTAAMQSPADLADSSSGEGQLASESTVVMTEGGPIVVMGTDAAGKFESVLAKVEVALPVMRVSDNSDEMRGLEDLPPRLGHRWDELQRVRRALSGRP